MQTDAPLSPGNSGGPVLLLNGTVVGLVDAGDTSAQGISYAVPAMSAGPLFSTWRGDPSPQLPATCPATTPSGTTPPATIPSNEFYPGADFSIDYPTGWVVTHLQLSGGNLDTTFQPPGASRVEPFIRVDENPVDNESLAASAAPEISHLEEDPTYSLVSLTYGSFEGVPCLRWEFEDSEQGIRLHKVDTFLIDPYGHGWAVLFQSPAAEWGEYGSWLQNFVATFSG